MTKHQFTVREYEQDERIDKLLVLKLPDFSRTEIQKLIKEYYVTVNGQQIKPNYRCEIHDQIVVQVPKEEEVILEPENIPIEIVHEDESILLVNKPRGMVVHPTIQNPKGTLVNALLYHTDKLSNLAGQKRPGIVHRLDKDTSGILVVAKTDDAYKALSKQFFERKVKRTYRALVHGDIPHERGTIRAPIGRDPKHRTKMTVRKNGREAITHFVVKKRFGDYTYVQCELETGRMHQIRVHMHYIGHSIVGDPLYIDHKTLQTNGQLLYAQSLRFIHPTTSEEVYYEVSKPILFQKVMNEIGVEYL